jgi:hypothetical protein
MVKQKFVIKVENLRYPTKEEIKYANSQCPQFSNFDFKYQNSFFSILDGKKIEEAAIIENLHWWDNILLNRFGSLRGAYFDALTHYRRGFPEEHHECNDIENVNRILFDSNAEIFYYFFFVSCDVIGQILRLSLKLDINERKLHFNDVLLKKLPVGGLRDVIKTFFEKTEMTRKYRNSFTHRFPPNYPDFRVITSVKEGRNTLSAGSGVYTKPSVILKNIEESLFALSKLMDELKRIIIPK